MTRDVGKSASARHPDATALLAGFSTKTLCRTNGQFATFGWRTLAHPIVITTREQTTRYTMPE